MNDIKVRIGTCALASAFGTAVLVPALRLWSDLNIVWWLFFLLLAGIAIGAGTPALKTWPRALISLIPSAFIATYIAFRILMLKQTIGLSGITSDNPQFWGIVGFIAAVSWPLTFAFSYCKDLVAWIVGFIFAKGSEAMIERASKTITAIIGLISVIGLLIGKFVVVPS